jgi:hypothetical protein
MATVDLASFAGTSGHPSRWSGTVRTPYLIGKEISLAAAVTAKGSALAANDVIEALDIPAGTMVLEGGAIKTLAMTGTSTDLTFDIGITGGDVDNFVDGWDFDGAAVNSYATPVGVNEPIFFAADDTIDILFATQTGTVLTGKLWVFAVCVDVDITGDTPGSAALGS